MDLSKKLVIVTAVLIIPVAGILWMAYSPGIAGFAVSTSPIVEVGEDLTGNGEYIFLTLPQEEELSSVSIGGEIEGEGLVNVYLRTANDDILIYSNKDNLGDDTFLNKCTDTCFLTDIYGTEFKIAYDIDEETTLTIGRVYYNLNMENKPLM